MKKLICLLIATFVFTTVHAQKITDKDLQGEWKLVALNANGISADIATEKVTISDEMKSQVTPDVVEQINMGMKQAITQLKGSSVNFSGNTVKQVMAGKDKNGTYAIKESDGKQLLSSTWSDNTTTDTTIWIKDKQLHIQKSGQGQDAEFVFVKS